MKCSVCGYERNPASAHFCVGCGRRLVEIRETHIEVTQSVGHIAEDGRATALQVEKMTGNVTMNVVQLNLSPEMMAKLAAVSTEVKATSNRSTSENILKKSPEKERESVHQVI